MSTTETRTPEEQSRYRAKYLSGLIWHVGVFVIINVFFWTIDLALGQEGLQWAYWITGFWGLALAFHALAYFVAGRQLEARKARQYLGENSRS